MESNVEPTTEAGKEFVNAKDKKKRIQILVNSFSRNSNRKERRKAAAYFAKQLANVDI